MTTISDNLAENPGLEGCRPWAKTRHTAGAYRCGLTTVLSAALLPLSVPPPRMGREKGRGGGEEAGEKERMGPENLQSEKKETKACAPVTHAGKPSKGPGWPEEAHKWCPLSLGETPNRQTCLEEALSPQQALNVRTGHFPNNSSCSWPG